MSSCARCATVYDSGVRTCPRDGTSIPACHVVLRETASGILHDLDLFDAPTVLGRGAPSLHDPRLFADETVSARHASMRHERGEVVLDDSNSRNGTFVNGRPARGARLHVGDTIALGGLEIAVEAIVFDAGLPVLVVEALRGGEPGGRLTFRKAVVTFGRAPANDVVMEDPHGFVSRQHAELAVTPAGIVLRDLGSVNGTFVNGAPVRSTALRSGATIAFPPSFFAFRVLWAEAAPASPASPAPPRRAPDRAAAARLRREVGEMMSQLRAGLRGMVLDPPRAAHAGAVAGTFVETLTRVGRALDGLVPPQHPAMVALRGRAASVSDTAARIVDHLRREGETAAAILPLVDQAIADFVLVHDDAVDAALELGADPARIRAALGLGE